MSDEPTNFERITRSMLNHDGEEWSPERTKQHFHLFSHSKRAEAIDLVDDHLRRTDPTNIRDYARISKLRRDLVETHTILRKAGR